VEESDGLSETEARALLPDVLQSARTVPLEPTQALSPAELTANGMPLRSPAEDEEVEADLNLHFYKAKLKSNAADSVITVMTGWSSFLVGRLIYGEIRNGRYQMLWDSPLVNGHGRLDFADVNAL
jgi:hypothetical protein